MTQAGVYLVLRVADLNYSKIVSFFLFLRSVYTLLGAIKRYGLQPENLKIGISSVLTLYLH